MNSPAPWSRGDEADSDDIPGYENPARSSSVTMVLGIFLILEVLFAMLLIAIIARKYRARKDGMSFFKSISSLGNDLESHGPVTQGDCKSNAPSYQVTHPNDFNELG